MRMASTPVWKCQCPGSYRTPISSGLFAITESKGYVPTQPKTAVKMMSMKLLEKLEMAVAQPRSRPAAAGLGQMGLVTKAGTVLFR